MLLRRIAAVLACTLIACSVPRAATALPMPGPLGNLQTELASMTTHAPGHVGILVTDLHTGLSTGINSSASMPAASTIKIPVMVEVFRQMAAGAFDLNREVTLEQSDRDWGWGDLASAPGGGRYSVSKLLWLMITNSDNTATNMLIRLVGRQHINATMSRLGRRETRVADYIRSNGDIRDLRSSPMDLGWLLEQMAHDRLVDAWSSRAMITILAGQRHNSLLPEPLPPGTEIAHKTGTLHDTLNDVGIVYLASEPYVIAVMTTNLPTLDAGRQFIRGVSRLAYDSFARFASWRMTNAVPPILDQTVPAAPPPDLQMWSPPNVPPAQPVDPDPDAATPPPPNPAVPGPIASAAPAI
jgi:beta-lactamase class A